MSLNEKDIIKSVTVAPYYDNNVTFDTVKYEREKIDYSFKKIAKYFAKLFDVNIIDVSDNIGGFKFSEGDNAGKTVNEVSYTFNMNNITDEDGRLFASLMGDLGYEQQEAVIFSKIVSKGNGNGLQFQFKYHDINSLLDALKFVEIDDYTIIEKDNTFVLFFFGNGKNEMFNVLEKLMHLTELLDNNIYDISYGEVQSYYIDRSYRKGLYEAWINNSEMYANSILKYYFVKKAYDKVKDIEITDENKESYINGSCNYSTYNVCYSREKLDKLVNLLDKFFERKKISFSHYITEENEKNKCLLKDNF